jgi:hypothetical protein
MVVAGFEYHADFGGVHECAQLLAAVAAMPLAQAQYRQPHGEAARAAAAAEEMARPSRVTTLYLLTTNGSGPQLDPGRHAAGQGYADVLQSTHVCSGVNVLTIHNLRCR